MQDRTSGLYPVSGLGVIILRSPIVKYVLLKENRFDIANLVGEKFHLFRFVNAILNRGAFLHELSKGEVLALDSCIVERKGPFGEDNRRLGVLLMLVNAH